MKRYTIDKNTYKELTDILKNELTSMDNIVLAYLHGSFNEMDNFGDIDIAMLLKNANKKEALDYELILEDYLEKTIPYPVDARNLNYAPPAFRYNVIKNGIILFEKDENLRVEFEMLTYKLYFDFKPFRERYFKEALNL